MVNTNGQRKKFILSKEQITFIDDGIKDGANTIEVITKLQEQNENLKGRSIEDIIILYNEAKMQEQLANPKKQTQIIRKKEKWSKKELKILENTLKEKTERERKITNIGTITRKLKETSLKNRSLSAIETKLRKLERQMQEKKSEQEQNENILERIFIIADYVGIIKSQHQI